MRSSADAGPVGVPLPVLRRRARPRDTAQPREGLRELLFGEYLDALPGRWLVWHGHGPLGPNRYACAEHRGDLVAHVREHYGTIAPHPWKMPPYASSRRSRDTERAIANGGFSSIPKWGLGS